MAALVETGPGLQKQNHRRMNAALEDEPRKVQVAALPWRVVDDKVEVMLITSRDTGRWILPKGWPERRETLAEAAAREAAEEAGISGGITQHPIGSFAYDKVRYPEPDEPCQVFVYPLQVSWIAERWPERKQRERRWFAPDAAAAVVNEPDLSELILEFGANPQRFGG